METNIHFTLCIAQLLLEWEMFWVNVMRKVKTHFIFSNIFFFENRAFREIVCNNIADGGRTHMTICRMRIACWIPKATNTHSKCVIFIAFPLHQWITRMPLSITLYVHCLSCSFPLSLLIA